MDLFLFLLPPLTAGLILTGIHAYLGLHIVSRGVIFVDLSLAQIAAFGTTVAFLAGYGLHSDASYVWSLGATFIGAAVFAFTRMRNEIVPQEAIIGIVYAVSAAATILAVSHAPEGAEHIKDMLVGNILTVSWAEIFKTAVLYALIGLLHWFLRRKFFLITLEPKRAYAEGYAVKWWDFLFYASFGVVVTSSVKMAGVLVVFSYLVVPAVIAILFTDRVGWRLALGWIAGTVASGLGVAASFFFDLPTGPTIICTFGAVLILCAIARNIIRRFAVLSQ